MKTYSRYDFTREERAARAKVAISAAFESKEQAFLEYNNSIADAVAHLGKPEDIGRVFVQDRWRTPGPATTV
jgi:type I restriction enzyme R subunit